jgi:hypothetical protein
MSTILGTRLTSATWPGLSIGGSGNNQRGYSYLLFRAPAAGYITRFGLFGREISNSNPKLYGVVYNPDQDGTPGDQLGRTALQSIDGSGSDFNFPIAWSDPELRGAQTAIRVAAGQSFILAVKNQSGTVEIARLPGMTLYWLRNVNTASPPTDPFSPTSTETDTPVALYVEFEENRPPVAALTAPVDGSTVNTTTPIISGTFTDPDSVAPMGDRLSAYALQVIRVADGQEMWGGAGAVFAASPAERAANTFSRAYSGNPLAAGTGPYEVRAIVFDDSGAASPLSAPRTFSINAAGQVTVGDGVNPIAKVETDSALIDWDAKWHHPTALAMKAARVRVRLAGTTTVVKEGFLVNKAVVSSTAPGTAFTIQDTEAGIGVLEPGTYEYDVQGQATDNQFSPWSVDARTFVVNAPPTQPSNLQPPDGAVSTDRPLLEWNVFDPDENFATGGQSRVQFQRPNGSTFEEVTTNYDADTGKGFLQTDTTSVLEAVKGRTLWRVRGEDVSAGVLGEGPWSKWQAFDYLSGPDVEITSPVEGGDPVTTSTPTIAWNSSGQARYRVQMYMVDVKEPFRAKDGTGSASTFQVPAGWLINGGDYDVDVTVWDGSNNKGTSLRRQFRVEYIGPPTLTNLQASLHGNRFDPTFQGLQQPSSIRLSWTETIINPGEFGGYIVRRRISGQTLNESVRMPTITTPGQAQWIDHLAPANSPLIYTVSQLRKVSAQETLESDVAEVAVELPRLVPILCSAKNPGDLRLSMMWIDGPNLSGSYLRDQALEKTWGSGQKRVHMAPPKNYGARRVVAAITIRRDDRGTLYDHADAVDDLVESGEPLMWGPPRPRARMFCVIEGDSDWKMGDVGEETRTFRLIEIDWTEGVKEDVLETVSGDTV